MEASQSRPAVGDTWTGPATFTTDPEIGQTGYYALQDDGSTFFEPQVRLSFIDDAPEDEDDGSGHYIVVDPAHPYYPTIPPSISENEVALEAFVTGTSEVAS